MLSWVHKLAVIQCSSCLRWGHHVFACKSIYPFSLICAGPHQAHSHDIFLAKGFVNSALKLPRCINCVAAKKLANHTVTSQECPFIKVHHSRRGIMVLLHLIWGNKMSGFKSPFNSHYFDLPSAELTDISLQILKDSSMSGSLVQLDGSTCPLPSKKKKGKTGTSASHH